MQQACALISGFVVPSSETEGAGSNNKSLMSRTEKVPFVLLFNKLSRLDLGLPISETDASISYNANDLICQYSKWTCPC